MKTKMTKPLLVMMTPKTHARYVKHADFKEESLSNFVRRALDRQLEEDLGKCHYKKKLRNEVAETEFAKMQILWDAEDAAAVQAAHIRHEENAKQAEKRTANDPSAPSRGTDDEFLENWEGPKIPVEVVIGDLEQKEADGEVLKPGMAQMLQECKEEIHTYDDGSGRPSLIPKKLVAKKAAGEDLTVQEARILNRYEKASTDDSTTSDETLI